jgi:Flp pilus assembly protein TadB
MSDNFWIVPAVAIVAVFTLVTVTTWSDSRRQERESFHRHELFRQMLERQGASVEEVRGAIVDLMREEETLRRRKQADGEKLGGLITAAVGISLGIFLYFLAPGRPIFLFGGIPLAVGLMLLVHSLMISRPRAS